MVVCRERRKNKAYTRTSTATLRVTLRSVAALVLFQMTMGFSPHLMKRFVLKRDSPTSGNVLYGGNQPFRTFSTIQFMSPTEEFVDAQTTNSSDGFPPPFAVTLEKDDYSYKEAVLRTLGWVSLAGVFGCVLWAVGGSTVGEEFFAGYLVEQSLSVDNLFVFLLLFEYFKVPVNLQDRVLNWGIYGAIVMRAVMIGLGAAALQQFHAILLVFASILIYSSAKFFVGDEGGDEEDPSQNTIVKFSRSLIPSTDKFHGKKFFTIEDGIKKATPLFICMIAVEISDVVFAVDSIPAVFGVTEVSILYYAWHSYRTETRNLISASIIQNPLIVFSSNMFAIMGLRSMYTILSKAATDLKYLEPAVALVLGFIGSKMVAEYFGYEIPTNIALGVVASLLISGVGASVWDKQQRKDDQNE
jgi:predicted tellurium resistance membrane protein TerC